MARKKSELHPVDRLGIIKAKLAVLEEAEERARAAVLALGDGQHSGTWYDATVSDSVKVTLNAEAVKEKLGELWVRRHSTRTPYKSVRVTARRTRKLRRAA